MSASDRNATRRALDTAAGQQKSPEYLALNPNGVVPTLVMDGVPRFEAAALLMTLADGDPQHQLAHRGALYRADVAVGIGTVEPGKASGIQAQLEAQRGKQAHVAGLVLLQFRPQGRLSHAVQMLAGKEKPE